MMGGCFKNLSHVKKAFGKKKIKQRSQEGKNVHSAVAQHYTQAFNILKLFLSILFSMITLVMGGCGGGGGGVI